MSTITLSKTTMRRYILGKQGLWPGRRWKGKQGAGQAIREIGAVQIDPLVVVARNHDLKLYSRVAGYLPEHLDALLYQDREFFDYGGLLMIFPMSELPYWRVHMKRVGEERRYAEYASQHQHLFDEVRAELRTRGPLGHRDMEGHARVESYRARKDTGLVLFNLWITGELMTNRRRRFERLYDFAENVAPARYNYTASVAEAEAYFEQKALTVATLATLTEWKRNFSWFIRRSVLPAEVRARLDALVGQGSFVPVNVEGRKDTCYLFAADLPIIDTLQSGRIPDDWQPLEAGTLPETNFLAPLDPVSARGRARVLFDFDYIWEVYKPVEQRRWGYYTLPILYGNELVARLDPKLERGTRTMAIKGFWLESPAQAGDTEFAGALGRGLARFARFHDAEQIDLEVIRPVKFRRQVEKAFKSAWNA